MEVFIDKKLETMELVTQHLVMPRDLNNHGNLFGGMMLAWIDEGCAMFVMEKIRYSNIVTVAMDEVLFKSPGKSGDIIEIYAEVNKTGRSSIKVRCTAISRSLHRKELSEIIDCMLTYVCLGDDGKPFPYFDEHPAM